MGVNPDLGKLRIDLLARAGRPAAKRFRRILPEQRLIVVGEAPKLDEAVLDGDLPNRGRCRVTVPENGMNRTKPFVAQVGDRSQTEDLEKRAMQSPSRDVEVGADLRHMHGPNPGGLEKAGSSGYKSTFNSGNATIGTPGSGSLGSLQAGALEMSNVDLSQEFTNLIVAQRGFQANARIITTSDEVLQELTQLKR